MFATIIEIEHVLDMIKSYQLNEQQINKLLSYIKENPTISVPKLIEIVDDIQDGKYVLLNAGEFSLDPILNESKTVNLMQITLPIITKHIPKEILGYLTEVHVRYIVDKILDVDFIPGDDNVLGQVPPPPQADGRNIPFSESVESIVLPGLAISSFSSLIVIFTSPAAVSFALAYSK